MLTPCAFGTSTLRLAIAIAAVACLLTESRAERVGYSFHGKTGNFPLSVNLFGVPVPSGSPISGTFSYDDSSPHAPAQEGGNEYHQSIHGGFSLNIFDASSNTHLVQLAAHEFKITAVNDYTQDPLDLVDYVRVEFDKQSTPTAPPIWVNGVPYAGAFAKMNASLSWPHPTFDGPNEPALHSELPLDSTIFMGGIAQSSRLTSPNPGAAAQLEITSVYKITPSAGDLNFDGKIGISDFIEWRKAFGGDSASYPFADMNADGAIDGADYVFLRKAASQYAAGAGSPAVPEPTTIVAMLLAALLSTPLFRRK